MNQLIIRKHPILNRVRDQEAAARELLALYEEHGELRAELVLERARDPASALHEAFEWDDSEAAHRWRLDQARALIRSVRVAAEDKPREEREVFVHVSEKHGYHTMETVIRRPDFYALAFGEASQRLRSAEEAVERLRTAALETGEHSAERLLKIEAALEALRTARVAVETA